MQRLTIFTPTYNRADRLSSVYASLSGQTRKEFTWLIVDDGSVDDTPQRVAHWQKEADFQIQYVYQQNGGKMAALKKGIDCCKTDWFVCVDSDDRMTPDGVSQMLEDIRQFPSGDYAGYVYPQEMAGGDGRWVPDQVTEITVMDLKNLYGVTETAILVRTELLKKISVPCFAHEKFMSEEILYILLAEHGSLIPERKIWYLSEYQPDGLTRNLFRHWVENPRGTILLLQMRFHYSKKYAALIRSKERVKCILNLNALCMACRLPIKAHTPSRGWSWMLYIPSLVWKLVRFRGN